MNSAVAERVGTPGWDKINMVDRALAVLPQAEMPLEHIFAPGQYVRTIFMPAGTLLTTRIHLTEHPFFILAGTVTIFDGDKSTTLRAPFIGVTKPGTRRVLFIHEDCIFATSHVTTETDPDKLVDLLTMEPVDLGHLDDLTPEQLAAVRAVAKPQRQLP